MTPIPWLAAFRWPAAIDLPKLLDGFTWAQGATLIAAFLAVCGVAATILTTSARARRDHLATLYADALHGVADYLEGPYRIRRKDGTATHRNTITSGLSDVKSAIDHSQALLRLHARKGVADAFDAYVNAAKFEAGKQMTAAWTLPAVLKDEEVNLGAAYDRTVSNASRAHVVSVMQADLARRRSRPWRFCVYHWRLRHAPRAPNAAPAGPDAPASVCDPVPLAVESRTVRADDQAGGPRRGVADLS